MNEADVMQLHNDLIEVGQRLDERQMIAGTGGNLSVRLPDDTILITRSGSMLGRLQMSDFVRVNLKDGSVSDGSGKPTSELHTHLVAYQTNPNITSIVHAHPNSCIALMLRGWTLDAVPLAEAAYSLGSVPTCDFAVPGSDEGGEVIKKWAGSRYALLLDRHGAFTFGNSPFDALSRMEVLDAVAQIVLLAGGPAMLKPMHEDEVDRVVENALRYGVRGEMVTVWAEKVNGRL
ncbi:MAG TPA: class II aldolase/adducin family protein [Bacteroidetes bacterium]|nr:class II aldolase/adducin family protein [Bacteroidota bacterium]HEX04205.1 class II aldolase/adducin family protein [Bacteroidota bacterium]